MITKIYGPNQTFQITTLLSSRFSDPVISDLFSDSAYETYAEREEVRLVAQIRNNRVIPTCGWIYGQSDFDSKVTASL